MLAASTFGGVAQAMEMTGDAMMKKDSAMMQKDAMVMELMKQVEALNALIMVEKEKAMKKSDAMSGDAMMKKDDAMMQKDVMMQKDAMMVKDAMTDGDLSEGSHGDAVVTLQTLLEEKGHLTIPAGVAKGYFGALTKVALMKYQAMLGVKNTGYYGPLTRAAMKAMMQKDGAMMEKKGDAMMEKAQ